MNDNLHHHGIKGQKWGVRRFQNKDGSLTPAGKQRYDDEPGERKEVESKNRSSKGKRIATALLRTVLVDTAVRSVSTHLIMSGKEEAGKALHIIGATYSWVSLGMDIGDVIIDKDE